MSEPDALTLLVREYLRHGSHDGRVERQALRRALARMVEERPQPKQSFLTTQVWLVDDHVAWSVNCTRGLVGIGRAETILDATKAANRAIAKFLKTEDYAELNPPC